MSAATRPRRPHYVYLLRCGARTYTYYVGWTTDPARRLAEHRRGFGARYTRGRGPLRIVCLWRLPTRTAALRLEYRLKQLPRALKHDLAGGRALDGVVPPRRTARLAKTAR